MEFEKRHDTTDTTDFCPLLAETGVMAFGHYCTFLLYKGGALSQGMLDLGGASVLQVDYFQGDSVRGAYIRMGT